MKHILTLASLLLCIFVYGGDYSLKDFSLSPKGGILSCGEEAVLSGLLLKNQQPVTEGKVRIIVRKEGKEVATKDFACDGNPFHLTWTSDTPCWYYFGIQVLDKDGKVIAQPGAKVPQHRKKLLLAEAGLLFSPAQITAKNPVPEDFGAFWKAERAKVSAIPLQVEWKPAESGDPAVLLYTYRAEAGTERPATGFLAVPAKSQPKSHPAFVDFLSWSWVDANKNIAIQRAKQGCVALAASWHGLEAGRQKEFYTGQQKLFNALRLLEDREKWEFHQVYLRVLRTMDIIKSRPEWNGKDLIVQGGSLGGAQTMVAAALEPAVTLAVVSVPAFCDFEAGMNGRNCANPARGKQLTDAMRNALAYHDLLNFAPHVHCEVFFCTGLADELCCPSNVYSVYNRLPQDTKKTMYINPFTGHYGTTQNVSGNQRLKQFLENVQVREFKD